jgi:hypothetical protein
MREKKTPTDNQIIHKLRAELEDAEERESILKAALIDLQASVVRAAGRLPHPYDREVVRAAIVEGPARSFAPKDCLCKGSNHGCDR